MCTLKSQMCNSTFVVVKKIKYFLYHCKHKIGSTSTLICVTGAQILLLQLLQRSWCKTHSHTRVSQSENMPKRCAFVNPNLNKCIRSCTSVNAMLIQHFNERAQNHFTTARICSCKSQLWVFCRLFCNTPRW